MRGIGGGGRKWRAARSSVARAYPRALRAPPPPREGALVRAPPPLFLRTTGGCGEPNKYTEHR